MPTAVRISGFRRAARLIAIAGVCAHAAHAETPAGTHIVNVGHLTYIAAGQPAAIASNESRITVGERLDIALAARAAAKAADGSLVAAALLTNQGNGQEAFQLEVGAAAPARLAFDGDGDGRYDSAHDPELAGGTTPLLAAGQTVAIFALLPAGTSGSVTLTAAAVTGSGQPGTTFPGSGDGGGDAIAGPTGAHARVTLPLGSPTGAAPGLAKSATVTAPDRSGQAMRGATITYALVATFAAATEGAAVTDIIPAGTAYAPASLTLDGAPLSDAADGDAGDADPARIRVTLDDQPAGATRTIRFKVVIQ